MSCRSTPAGSLITTYAQQAYGLEDGQCTSLFHELRRTTDTRPAPTPADYTATLDDIEERLRSDTTWQDRPALRERALARVARARTAGYPGPEIASALIEMPRRAAGIRQRLGGLIAAVQAGVNNATAPAIDVSTEYRRLYREYRRGLPGAEDFLQPIENGWPQDPASRYAISVLTRQPRCTACGRYLSTGTHTCPSTSTTPAPTVTTPPAELPLAPYDMDGFQALYDTARNRLTVINPTIPAINATRVGEVTGGLGTREHGTSFGIELELDFPDDDYPYRARHDFASALHRAGVASSPYVNSWHYVGPGRPGGSYDVDPHGWIAEFDRSVDDVDGQRGVEVKSQILYDEPETWAALATICRLAAEHGAQVTPRTGLHVNIGSLGYPADDPEPHARLLRLAATYDDTLIRLAHNPASAPRHRGRNYCGYTTVPPTGFHDVAHARRNADHYAAINLGHLPAQGERSSDSNRIEVRIWDGALDIGRIQAAVTTSLILTTAARTGITTTGDPEPQGSHRRRFGRAKLTGQDWTDSTESFRNLLTLAQRVGADSPATREQLVSLFAESRWQD